MQISANEDGSAKNASHRAGEAQSPAVSIEPKKRHKCSERMSGDTILPEFWESNNFYYCYLLLLFAYAIGTDLPKRIHTLLRFILYASM